MGSPRISFGWEPSEPDRHAELEHVDGQRRPWRAFVLGLVVLAAISVVRPLPWTPLTIVLSAAASMGAAIAGWQFPVVRMRRSERCGSTSLRLGVDPLCITIERGGFERRLSPAAIERLVVGADHVFLHLTQSEVLTIPCRVFHQRGELDRFVEGVDRFRRRGLDPVEMEPPDAPEPNRTVWSLVYHLAIAESIVSGSTRDGDLHRLLVAVLVFASLAAMLSPTALLSSGDGFWQTGQELLLLVLFAGVGGLFAAAAGRSRAPRGQVTLAVGPDGGWMHTSEGTARFDWVRVLGIELSPGLVVLRFVDRVVPVPSSAFINEETRRRFAHQTRRWCREARLARKPAQMRIRPLVLRSDPFDPPFDPLDPRGD